ncbi:MAG: tetratricopeptide repeat protein [Isosphaeraceae bacterium]
MIPIAETLELAVKQQRAGNLRQAETLYRQVLEVDPEHVDALHLLGVTSTQLGQHEQAGEYLLRALKLRPEKPEVHNNLGVVLKKQGRLEEAIACYHHALLLRPDYPQAHNNLGIALLERGQLEEAENCLRAAIGLEPNYAEAYTQLGVVLLRRGKTQEAAASCEEALRLRPGYPEAHRNMGMLRLILGDFERGWQEYEWRWQCKEADPPAFPGPWWDGSPLEGRTIFLFAEQGLGDTLQFVRYAPMVARRGGRVWLLCSPAVAELLTGCEGIERVIPNDRPIPPFDVHVPLMSLPGVLGTTLATVPADVPYIRVGDASRQYWQQQLAGLCAFKIGISWQGNPKHPEDRKRSIALQEFAPLANVPGVQLISLQNGVGTEQLQHVTFPIMELCGALGLAEKAAVIQNLDLVITIDSAIAHLAGALAARVWVALAALPDFRWLLDREDSPWYPTMRLFRQGPASGWQPVFARMAEEVSKLIGASRK